ncbi:hypothetical protein [Thiocystis minor]|uniref:hypothetical protein n=1 Tax=Thiocystis minor TaxID=61597 RepID=UPI001F5D193D|nr:hypothetical protein [Thiocystis minor]
MVDHQLFVGCRRGSNGDGNDARAEKRRQKADESCNGDASWHRGSSGFLGHLVIVVADQASDTICAVTRQALAEASGAARLKLTARMKPRAYWFGILRDRLENDQLRWLAKLLFC